MADRIVRHAGFDRLLHWVTAISVLVLLATAFLPILGIEFAWVAIHWWSGLVLIAAVLIHVLRSLLFKKLALIWIGPRDIRDALGVARYALRASTERPAKPGKYSFAQKFIHLAFAVVVLSACITGAMMMVKIDTPWWERNPYWLSDETWGLIYVVHGFAALFLITMVMAHVYFALRPEKLMFLRSMLRGWISKGEYERQHDPERWQANE
jgi:formate dehydrogenase subunit gamma